jgi:hypothetical protein
VITFFTDYWHATVVLFSSALGFLSFVALSDGGKEKPFFSSSVLFRGRHFLTPTIRDRVGHSVEKVPFPSFLPSSCFFLMQRAAFSAQYDFFSYKKESKKS